MKAILFDLDNTLYDYREYFYQVFLELSQYFHEKHQIPKKVFIDTSMDVLNKRKSRYPRLFNEILQILKIPEEEILHCINVFNKGEFRINPYTGVHKLLAELKKRKYLVGIITDGNPIRQGRKIKCLNIENYLNIIVYTEILGTPKPSSYPYLYTIEKLKINPMISYYVGDDPYIDFLGARHVGLKTIRILKGEFSSNKGYGLATYEVNDLLEVLKVIEENAKHEQKN